MFRAAFRIILFLCTVTTFVSNSPLIIPILTFAPITAEVLKIVFRLSNSRQNSLEGGSDHCNASVTIGKQEEERQSVPKCVPAALDRVLISGAWPSVDADGIPRLQCYMHVIPQSEKSFLLYLVLLKIYHIKMSQIVIVNILDHFTPYSTALYKEPFLATLDTLEFDHL